MLHVHNGDCSADVLKRSGLPGNHLVWRESLITGPTPQGLTSAEWQTVRSQHLAEDYALNQEDCERNLTQQAQELTRFSEHHEVILWFEHDLFCQTLVLYLLNWFSQCNLGKTRLSLVCIGEFPGITNFRGLGQLTPTQMASLFEARQAITSSELSLASRGWEAYCSPNPKAIEEFLEEPTDGLAYLRPALQAHLARFPSVRNGLGQAENRALDLVSSGAREFASIFTAFGAHESIYGFGDSHLWLELAKLAKARRPLLAVESAAQDNSTVGSQLDLQARFSLTETGDKVLRGQADFVRLNGLNRWLGGAHLNSEEKIWRWDEAQKTLAGTL